jgi:hypothetical protein
MVEFFERLWTGREQHGHVIRGQLPVRHYEYSPMRCGR